MKLKNVLLVVSDLERSKRFYKTLFGLEPICDLGENVILMEGLVLQERKSWEDALGKKAILPNYGAELYFEEQNLDSFLERLRSSEFPMEILNQEEENAGGCRAVRIYDPDGHVIEIGGYCSHPISLSLVD